MPQGDDESAPSRLWIVSNRLQVTIYNGAAADFTVERSSGRLATALSCPHAERDCLWLGWPGGHCRSAATRQRPERLLHMDYRCVPVFLSARDIQLFYDGCSNRVLWPLYHFLQVQVTYNDEEWEAYVQANRIFCEVIAQEARGERKEMQTAFWRRPRRSPPSTPC